MAFIVYVIQNKKGLLYKGFTTNLQKRLEEHQKGISRWTRYRGPWQLVYHEETDTKQQALQREKFLKSGQGREFLKQKILSLNSSNVSSGRSSAW